jgi:DNA-binding MarR family transcriptional regulator
MNTKQQREDEERLLELLDAVQQRSDLSQRGLARHMGVALGLANSYLKRCIRKGLIKISAAPANRYLYYLTPKGFSEKSRLTARYLSTSFDFYRRAGESCIRTLDECEARSWRHIVLYGASDLAEIAALRALERDVAVVGIVDPDGERKRLIGQQVWPTLKQAKSFDGCVLTDLQAPAERYRQLVSQIGVERVLVPDILRL